MHLKACLGLSPYDIHTLLYCVMVPSIFMLGEALCVYLYSKENEWIFFIAFMIHGLALHFTGFLSGIIIARSNIKENLESLGFVRTNAMSVLDNSITVI